MKKILLGIAKAFGTAGRATVALIGIAGITAAVANYAATQGSGTNFGSIVVSSVHYAQQLLCDVTTPSQCAAVSAAGAVKTDASATTQPVSGTVTANAGTNLNTSTLSTSANQTSELTKLDTIITNTGAAIPAGSAIIGKVGIDQTTPGTTNAVNTTNWPTAVDTNSGNKTASTPRFVLATDQPNLTTALNVALAANQSVNLAQVAGATTAVGSGVQATALRTTLATDSPGIVTLGQTTKSASVPVAIASDQLGANTAANSLPITVGPALLGSYCMGANSGTMAAGLAGGSPVFSFRYGAANLAIIRKITAEADDITTAFAAGAGKFDLIAARSFTASDTGGTAGTLTGNNGKLRTSFATTGVSDFRVASTATLTAGTRTLDAQPLASIEFAVPTSIDTGLLPTTSIYQSAIGESPLVLAQNEGFVLQATVPGTGTWVFSARVCWDEVGAF